ncbi:MAG: tryptophan-rich sensory protein [Parachlamydiaceae bacterium]|nr:tryptophan-rich sensory protein [Parachlamydiaceae bacterium]
MKQKYLWFSFIFFIIVCLIVQIVVSHWTKESVSAWYPTLVKPSWTPPDWIFGPVWSLLYIMIAISGWLIYKAEYSHNRSLALMLYAGQLALNLIWSFLFFSLRSPILGLIDIILLNIFIILTIIKAWSVRPLASLLMIPYLFWIMYATSLNAGIWLLNRSHLVALSLPFTLINGHCS